MSDIKIGFFSQMFYIDNCCLSIEWRRKKRVSSGIHSLTQFNSLQWVELKLNAQFSVGFFHHPIHSSISLSSHVVRLYAYARVSQSAKRHFCWLSQSNQWTETHFESNWTIPWFNVWNTLLNTFKWNECKKEMRRETQNQIGVYSGSAAVSLSDVWHQTIDPL